MINGGGRRERGRGGGGKQGAGEETEGVREGDEEGGTPGHTPAPTTTMGGATRAELPDAACGTPSLGGARRGGERQGAGRNEKVNVRRQ